MVVQKTIIDFITIGAILGIPALIMVIGGIIVVNFLRATKLLVQVSPKEFRLCRIKPHGNKIEKKIYGHKHLWVINSEPMKLDEEISMGAVPCYYAVIGQPKTSMIEKPKSEVTTSEELKKFEEQSVLNMLLNVSSFGTQNIIMLIGALGIGGLIGYIAGQIIMKGGA